MQKKTPKLQGVVNYIMYRGVNNFIPSISRSLQDHFGTKISSKSAKFELNGDVRSIYVLSRGEKVNQTLVSSVTQAKG